MSPIITAPRLSARLRRAAEQLAADVTSGTFRASGEQEEGALIELSLALAEFAEDALALEDGGRQLSLRERARALFGPAAECRPTEAEVVYLTAFLP